MPALGGGSRPFRRFVDVAVVAGIGCVEFDGQIGARDSKAMIVPPIDAHVRAHGHVAGGASERRHHPLVAVVRNSHILVGRMALQADAISCRPKLRAMRLMAIAAGDAGREHLALLEWAVVVDLVQHLPVGFIEAATYGRNGVGIRQPPTRRDQFSENWPRREWHNPQALDLLAQGGRRGAACGVASFRIDWPGDSAPLVEADDEALGRIIGLAK